MKRALAALAAMAFFMVCVPQGEAAGMAIRNGSRVSLDFTLSVDGKLIDSSEGKEPLMYTQGDGKLLPGLTKRLEGLKAGDTRSFELKPEEAYGDPNPAAFREVSLSQLPPNMKPEVGMMLRGQDKDGRVYPSRIAKVNKDSVLMDFNHPLAGKTLSFKIRILSVK
ncbi:MAG: peptidylprolyl isomerase [Candidatus Omnitrophica bacterium]|nr:peptidylprolyl isomerase [Candidatus Omnitrophota bacterium]